MPEITLSMWCTSYNRDAFPLKYSWKKIFILFIEKHGSNWNSPEANTAFSAHVNLIVTHWGKARKDNWKEKLIGTGTSLPFSLRWQHMDRSAVSMPSVTYFSTLGHEDHFSSRHPLKTLQSPVLNVHIQEWMNVTNTLIHSSPDHMFSNLLYVSLFLKYATTVFSVFLQLLFLTSLLVFLLLLISVSRILSKHNMRPPGNDLALVYVTLQHLSDGLAHCNF